MGETSSGFGEPLTLDGLRERVPKDGNIEILGMSDGTVAVLLQDVSGNPWFLAEESHYQPEDPDVFDIYEDRATGWPYYTYGDQWLVDLSGRRISTRSFRESEGTIQGFVYAMYGFLGDGPLSQESYVGYLREEISAALRRDDFEEVTEQKLRELEEYTKKSGFI